MTDAGQPPTPERIRELLDSAAHDEVMSSLDRLRAEGPDACKRAMRALRTHAQRRPADFDGLAVPLAAFLDDDDRALRLTTAKLFVALAESEPTLVLPAVGSLGSRLADEAEFYYVRARCAETLGYVALDHPDEVASPERLADLRVGLAFDEPEVRAKLAKALEYVALGDPDRLRHHVEGLADHLDDENELVRYHLTTTLVVVGAAYPGTLADVTGPLRERLDDSNPYVQGRAAEAVGLLPAVGGELAAAVGRLRGHDESFVADRAAFAVSDGPTGDGTHGETDAPLGTVEAVRATTARAVEAMTTPDSDGDCPQCGCSLTGDGPPMCPQCGAPR